jgi:predicted nucleotide-binding protein
MADETGKPEDTAKPAEATPSGSAEVSAPSSAGSQPRQTAPPEQGLMRSRFDGDRGKERTLEFLSNTSLFGGIPDLEGFLPNWKLRDVAKGAEIIQQGAPENSIFLIFSGNFEVLVNSRQWATRKAGSHVGELALIDFTARRSATVRALEPSFVAEIPEDKFTEFAKTHPELWRRLAVETARRLVERTRLAKVPRDQPVLFIGCSTEALAIAREMQSQFQHDRFVTQTWTQGVFNASSTSIEDLTTLVGNIDFATIILTPDDVREMREVKARVPRDNAIFELGLAIGAIGRQRTLIVCPKAVKDVFPSDLLGVQPIVYSDDEAKPLAIRLGPACNEIRSIVTRLGPI